MRVAGVDPDTKAITWAIVDPKLPGKVITGRVEVKGQRVEDRIVKLMGAFAYAVGDFFLCDWVYIERPVVVNRSAAMAQAQVVGAIRALLTVNGAQRPHTLVDSNTWKLAVLGNGAASKDQIKKWARAHYLTLDANHKQDIYDAVCIAHFGIKGFTDG